VVLDITRDQFEQTLAGRPFSMRIMRMPDITEISENYNDVPEGMPLCRFNMAGFMEIAVNHGHALDLLGLGSFNPADIRYQVVRVFF
jgi:hypothetical protein